MTAKKKTFVPYANEADVLQVDNLMIENRLDRITISGDVDLTADKVGLAHARRLKEVIDAVLEKLDSQALPERLPPPDVTSVANPFN
ncbi:hypothetical protein ACHAC9_01780 [Massilia sp. CMS3.1]|uniref:hypothetical protein n=1 Tax=Massilia sp. CMS3.1 TaxID=3373083 RepID=UPI003EE43E7F